MSEKKSIPLERKPGEAYIGLVLNEPSRRRHKWKGGVANRMIILGAGTFVKLQHGAEDILGDEASAVFYESGIEAGKDAVVTMFEELDIRGQELLDWMIGITDSSGIGFFKPLEYRIEEDCSGYIRIKQSFIAEVYQSWRGKTDHPVCHFIGGFLAGCIEGIFNVIVSCEETKCEAMGDEYCEFRVEPA